MKNKNQMRIHLNLSKTSNPQNKQIKIRRERVVGIEKTKGAKIIRRKEPS